VDKYRRHYLWKGGDRQSKKPPLTAWKMVTKSKKGGLGVINLKMQNKVLLLKKLHKFFNKADLPWVQLLWNQYYSNGKVPELARKGGFWWRSIVKMLPTYKGIAQATLVSGDSILFWVDMWNGRVIYPELFSFTTNPSVTVKTVTKMSSLQELFQLPLSMKAFDQFCELDIFMQSL
jgi:hypothetical protein